MLPLSTRTLGHSDTQILSCFNWHQNRDAMVKKKIIIWVVIFHQIISLKILLKVENNEEMNSEYVYPIKGSSGEVYVRRLNF